jgi:putative ABC transport system substrate-binding protein
MAGGLLAAPLAAEGQPAGKVWRIGLISVIHDIREDAFFQRLRELGYVEGQNVVAERRYSEGRAEPSAIP